MKVSVALFEDKHWENFYPLTLTKAAFDVIIGSKTAFELHGEGPKILLVRHYLADVTRERHPESHVNPDSIADDSDTIFFNGLLDPGRIQLEKYVRTGKKFAVVQGSRILAARPSKSGFEHLRESVSAGRPIDVRKIGAETVHEVEPDSAAAGAILSNPWEIIKDIKESLRRHMAGGAEYGKDDESLQQAKGVRVLGKGRVIVKSGATIEEGTVLDTTDGDIYVGEAASIEPSRIVGPSYIGSMTKIKQFSIIAESHIGKNCRIAGEIELSVVSDFTNKAHAGFLGHSYLGEWVNIGASTNTSDLKMTYGNIKMSGAGGRQKADTGINKLGSFFGDMSKTSIGTLVFSGRRIGVSSHLYGVISEDVPSFTIFGKGMGSENVELEIESAVETQRKMMSRRDRKMTPAYEKMIKHVFETTANDRGQSSVAAKKFMT